MFILYFDGAFHEYYHAAVYTGWTAYDNFRPGEGFWLVPGTDPEDDAYGRDIQDMDEDGNDGDQNDETLEYMCELLEAREIEPDEFRRQLANEGYDAETIRIAILQAAG
jgi:hypothetical protein